MKSMHPVQRLLDLNLKLEKGAGVGPRSLLKKSDENVFCIVSLKLIKNYTRNPFQCRSTTEVLGPSSMRSD